MQMAGCVYRAPAVTFMDKDPTQQVEEELPAPVAVPQAEVSKASRASDATYPLPLDLMTPL